jgi:hypothetical protein
MFSIGGSSDFDNIVLAKFLSHTVLVWQDISMNIVEKAFLHIFEPLLLKLLLLFYCNYVFIQVFVMKIIYYFTVQYSTVQVALTCCNHSEAAPAAAVSLGLGRGQPPPIGL